MGNNWDQCNAHARHLGDDGKERVVYCDQALHSPPGDNTEWHHDPDLEIYWRYADEFWDDEGN